MSNKSRIVAVTEQIKANNVVIGQMKTKVENLAQVTATAADVATGKVFVLPTGAVANGAAALSKPEQAKTMALAMASGDQVISPDSGKVLTAVTVTKPATLLPENIKQGVNIGGILGTLTGTVAGAALSSIAITTPPTKLIYTAGDAFDPAGMVVTATYSNGATRVVTGCTYAPAALVAGGNVTVSFTEFGVTQTAVVAVTVTTVPVYAPQPSGAGLGVVETAMGNNDGKLDANEQAILQKLRAGLVAQETKYYYLPLSGFVLAAFFANVLTADQCNGVNELLEILKTDFITRFGTYGSFEAVFTNPEIKGNFEGLARIPVGKIASKCACRLTTDIANFTFTLCDKNGGNCRSGSIYELFFDAKLV